MCAMYSLWDIVDDLIFHKVNKSDASVFAEEYGCCPAQFWGVAWFSVALIVTGLAIFLGLLAF